MKNIFSFISNEILMNQQQLEQIIYTMIPLTKLGNPLVPLKTFHENINNKLYDIKDIKDIADVTLDLCTSYLVPNIPMTSSFEEITLSHKLLMSPTYEHINKSIFNNTYKSELKTLMTLSYFYTKNIEYKPIHKNDERLLKFFENKFSPSYKTKQHNDPDYYLDPRKLRDKLHYFFKRNNNQPFMPFFFEGNPIKKSWSMKIMSVLDIEILLALIRSSSKKKNPFVSSMSPNININMFLQNLNLVTLDSTRESSILNYFSDSSITPTQLCIYNDFFLERITNLNFINAFYQLKTNLSFIPDPIISSLTNFIISPLLSTRLEILNYICNYSQTPGLSFDVFPLISNYLEKIFSHQILCALPITNLVFHYLMNIKFKNSSLFNEQIDYFFKNNDNHFFNFNTNKVIPMKHPLPTKPNNNTEYINLMNIIYKKFIFKSKYYSTHNFEELLNNIINKNIVGCLVNGFSNANIPNNFENPLNIIR